MDKLSFCSAVMACGLLGCGGNVGYSNSDAVTDAGNTVDAPEASAGGSSGHSGEAGTGGQGTGGSGGNSGAGATAGTGGSGANCPPCQALEQCWNGQLCVPKSVSLPAGFSIDATEVTRRQYSAWLATKPSTSGQSGSCAWNSRFDPDAACMADPHVCQGSGCDNHPQVCVDMCDASAYCNAVGKRVCGGIGGGQAPRQDDASKSQWFNACTSGGVDDFVYGNEPGWGKCNDYLSFTNTTVPVGSLAECQSSVAGYAGVYDLIGNVWEWEDNCYSADGLDICQPRGFSFGMGAAMPMCSGSNYALRSDVSDAIGLRCCEP
jgi:formylglycine-generating enzyme